MNLKQPDKNSAQTPIPRGFRVYKTEAPKSKILELVEFAVTDSANLKKEVNFSHIPNHMAQTIAAETGVEVQSSMRLLTAHGIRHALSGHGDHQKEQARHQIGITHADFDLLPTILNSPDSYEKGNPTRKKEQPAVLFKKKIGNKLYHVVMCVEHRKEGKCLIFNTMYIKPI